MTKVYGESRLSSACIMIKQIIQIAHFQTAKLIEPVHEISNNVVCATSKASDQPARTRSLIRAFACHLSIL